MSFSAYGGRDYVCGILRQIRLSKIFFPDWSVRVYLNSSVPRDIVDMVKREAQVVEIPSDSPFINSGMFWRLMIAEDEDVDVYCIRDSDSIFNYRESIAVEQWLSSGKGFNTMHDHLYHTGYIVGCCWCGRRRIKNMNQKMLQWKHREKWGDDQDFLNSQIWPIMKNDVVVYDTCESRRKRNYEIPFPTERIACEFVGIAYRKGINIWNYYPYLCYPKKT
ncbi:hypothetical protein B4U80_10937 [Leptotrombidium deliense]|uniref:Glycosyltransferase n=1 Tax=Leptotrombidium deliense TaxID=299467 RepID=A0A443ST91_9ACAR|nr:hypothetical protein B4U80_10937 [Leptotrombidium deliense]